MERSTSVNQTLLDFSVAKIVNSTIKKLSVVNKNSAIMTLVDNKLNSIICSFTQNYPDIPNKQMSEFCYDTIKATNNIIQTKVENISVDSNNNERKYNLIENPILISSCDKSPIISFSFEFNPTNQHNEPNTIQNKEQMKIQKTIKRKVKTGLQQFHFVLNFGFGTTPNGIILKCFTDYCNFKSYDRDIFKTHFESFHVPKNSNGICDVCKQNLVITNVKEEIEHIYSSHFNATPKLNKDEIKIKNNTVVENNIVLTEVLDSNINIMVDSKPIVEQITILNAKENIPIIPEMDTAIKEKCLMNQDTCISSSNLIATQIRPTSPLKDNTLSPVTDDEVLSVFHNADLEMTIPIHKIEKQYNKKVSKTKKNTKSTKSSKELKRSSNTIDIETVLKKKKKIDDELTKTPEVAAKIKKPFLRVILEKLSDEVIAQHLDSSGNLKYFSNKAHKTNEHKKSSKYQQVSIEKNSPKQLSHNSMKITKKVVPTSFKRSLSLNKSHSIISNDSSVKVQPIKIILKKCYINKNDNENGSKYYKVHNQTNVSEELVEAPECPPANAALPNIKETSSPNKIFDEILLLLEKPINQNFESKKSIIQVNKNSKNKIQTIPKTNLKQLPTAYHNKKTSENLNIGEPSSIKLPNNVTFRSAVVNLVEQARKADVNLVEPTRSAVDNLVEPSRSVVVNLAESSKNAVVSLVDPTRSEVVNLVEPSRSVVVNLAESSKNAVVSLVEPTRSEVVNLVKPSKNAVVSLVEPTRSAVVCLVEPTRSEVVNLVEPSKSAVLNLVEQSRNAVVSLVEPTKSEVVCLVEPTRSEVVNLVEPSKSAVLNLVEQSRNADVNLVEPSKSVVVNLKEPLTTKLAHSPVLVYGKFTVEEIVLEHTLINNEKQLSTNTDKSSIVISSPCNSETSSEFDISIINSPSNDHVPKVIHINFKLLQPWLLKRNHYKYDISCRTQLQKNGLLATFKCMGFTCSFHTCDDNLFKLHLKQHQKYVIDEHDTFLFCSYCLYNTKKIDKLIDHVMVAHQLDRYQCPYCFYRSCEIQSCTTHITIYHQFQKKFIMTCPINDVPIDVDELSNKIQLNRSKYVAPLRCTGKL